MSVRELHGMRYASLEIEHDVVTPMTEVLRQIADWLEENGSEHGLLTAIHTENHPEEEDRFLTSVVWAV